MQLAFEGFFNFFRDVFSKLGSVFLEFDIGMSFEIAIDGGCNNLLGGGEAFERFDLGATGFLQILVVVEVEFDLLDSLLGEVFQLLVFVAVVAIVFGNADDFVIDFAVVDEFHDAEDASFHPDAGSERLVGNHEDIEFVAVLIESLWDEAVVAGLRESHGFDAVEHKTSVFAVPFDFVVRSGGDFDDDVEFAFFVIAGG